LACLRRGLALLASRSITSTAPMTRIFPAWPLKESIAFAEGKFRLINFNDAFQRLTLRIEHRAPELLRQQPRGLVGDAKLVLQFQRRHTVGMGSHEVTHTKLLVRVTLIGAAEIIAAPRLNRNNNQPLFLRLKLFDVDDLDSNFVPTFFWRA
jgi:hypothetical protein